MVRKIKNRNRKNKKTLKGGKRKSLRSCCKKHAVTRSNCKHMKKRKSRKNYHGGSYKSIKNRKINKKTRRNNYFSKKDMVVQKGGFTISNLLPPPIRNFGRSLGVGGSNLYAGIKGEPMKMSPYPTVQPIDNDSEYIGGYPDDLNEIIEKSKNMVGEAP